MSDWGATHSGAASIEAGLDMDMPGGLGAYGLFNAPLSDFNGNITIGVNNGTIDVTRLDDMVTRIMTPYYFHGQDVNFPTVDPSSADLQTFLPRSTWVTEFNLTGPSSRDVRSDHYKIIRKLGAASTVLLKNTNATLPLKKPKSYAIFGNDASEDTEGYYNQKNWEFGTLAVGGGSGTGRLPYLITPLQAIKARAEADGAFVQQWLNNTLLATTDIATLAVPVMPEVCIVFLKRYAEEGADITSLDVDWNGNEVVEQVTAFCNNTVVVTHASGIINMPWATNKNVTAILAAHFPGQESGNSLADVLYGDVNPSAKLPYTIATNGDEYNGLPTTAVNTTGKEDWQAYFSEKLEIDYRYFDAQNKSVLYEFGFGLSYTTFGLTDLKTSALTQNLTAAPAVESPVSPGGNKHLWEYVYNVTATLTNTGSVTGAGVPQLYVDLGANAPAGTPLKQLRGFEKVELASGASATVSFPLMRRDLSYWDIISQGWVIPSGAIGIKVGFSSRDLVLESSITPVA